MSKLTEFYLREGTDSEGRYITEIWDYSRDKMDAAHDFIQWLFPLNELSNFNPDAPLLTDEDIALWRAGGPLKDALYVSFVIFVNFLGLDFDEKITKGQDWGVCEKRFWTQPDHNWLRITRVLKSLRILGLEEEAKRLYSCLVELRNEGYGSENSFKFWQEAMS